MLGLMRQARAIKYLFTTCLSDNYLFYLKFSIEIFFFLNSSPPPPRRVNGCLLIIRLNELGFRILLCTYKLYWASRASSDWIRWHYSPDTGLGWTHYTVWGLRPRTLPLGHGGSPQYWICHMLITVAWRGELWMWDFPGAIPLMTCPRRGFLRYYHKLMFAFLSLSA